MGDEGRRWTLLQNFDPLTPQRTESVDLEGVQRVRLVCWAASCSVRELVGERKFVEDRPSRWEGVNRREGGGCDRVLRDERRPG